MSPTTSELVVLPRPELFPAAARRFVAAVGEAIGQRGTASICLSGGSTPEELYRLLAREDYASRVDWSRVDIFWGDERCVPPTEALSNYRLADDALLSHIAVEPRRVHRIPGELGPGPAAARYENELAAHFDAPPGSGAPPRFDLLLLGLGEDGHTASLFPGLTALWERTRWAVPVKPKNEVARVTLTLPVLNAARQVHFLVVGEEKANALRHVIPDSGLEAQGDPETWPARLVRPDDARVFWFVDDAAARLLERRGS